MSGPIVIVGGSYAEECSFPRSTIYRGSGMRAASILTGLGNSIILHTVTGPILSADFAGIAQRKGISLRADVGTSDIWFRYRHPLSKPDIYPPCIYPTDMPYLADRSEIIGDQALVFGMIEKRPKVKAKRAIYDPQNGSRADSFAANGSCASELVILASLSEGRALTGKELPAEIASSLLANEGCVAAIVKCGVQGALVATSTSQKWIRSFPSQRVWKIGSGDVFSAAFAHAWFAENTSALQAACFASRMVAEYVGTRNEVFLPEVLHTIREEANSAFEKTTTTARAIPDTTIYLAGPFFTTSEQWLVDEARSAFRELGFKVFSPIHEVGEGSPNEIAPADLFGLESSGLVFALLDGLDAGTLFEVGYARARDIPVIGVAESVDFKALTMLVGSGCEILNDFSTAIYTACWELMGDV